MRWFISWTFYWAGDAVWRVFDRPGSEGMGRWSYGLYSWLMCQSDDWQGDGAGPWKDASGTEGRNES